MDFEIAASFIGGGIFGGLFFGFLGLLAIRAEHRKTRYFIHAAESWYRHACRADRKIQRMKRQARDGDAWKWE